MKRDLDLLDPETRLEAIAAVAASPVSPTAQELAALVDCLADERKLVQRRAAECIAALATRGADPRELLRAGLASGPPHARWGAAYALSLIEGPSPIVFDVLVETLASADGDLRWAAAGLLRQAATMFRTDVVDRLTAAAEAVAAPARRMALYALRELDARGARGVSAAERALEATDIELRLAGLAALARLADDGEAAATRIAELVTDHDPRMSRAAAAVLGTLAACPPQALAALRRARISSDGSLRRAAERSLRLLGKDDS